MTINMMLGLPAAAELFPAAFIKMVCLCKTAAAANRIPTVIAMAHKRREGDAKARRTWVSLMADAALLPRTTMSTKATTYGALAGINSRTGRLITSALNQTSPSIIPYRHHGVNKNLPKTFASG